MNQEFDSKITVIVTALEKAGYDPYAQLTGFIRTHDTRYITRSDNARALIMDLDLNLLKSYVKNMAH